MSLLLFRWTAVALPTHSPARLRRKWRAQRVFSSRITALAQRLGAKAFETKT
ncbi:hypothetical protein [Bordetella sp. LUAb4]|uniref:hypothetical protein n=1 Tax=Bordetella sp. LUAb4 TaxID=2843195 RepID=UPI001E3E6D23|nr:hypothetical protein [Bordetella sp. LUAb4]